MKLDLGIQSTAMMWAQGPDIKGWVSSPRRKELVQYL